MAEFSRTWWGRRFLEALEQFTDPGRLQRGRSYARGGKIIEHTLADSTVTARVRGSINPYFGVYKEPIYKTVITMTPIPAASWTAVLTHIAANARLVTALLMHEMPDSIENAFAQVDMHLLPHSRRDLTTSCSCPDYANPCKHVAGLYYLLAGELDNDPFLLFELRGLSRERLHAELARSPLGQILSSDLAEQAREMPIDAVSSYYTAPVLEPAAAVSHKQFWTGVKRLPDLHERVPRAVVPALLIKKPGDYPPFWHKDGSFIGAMEELYERVRTKSPQMK